MSTLPINTRLQNGAFAIGKVLGRGGFGITYLSGDMNLRRVVAIKEFFPAGCVRQSNSIQPSGALSATEYSSARTKFLEEARSLARFRHPGIVGVHTFFEENNSAYMVMEYLKGKTLAQLVEERGALPEQEAIGYIKKIGEALEELHRAQLLHRDVKPENVIVCEDGRAVLIDFGLTRKVEEVIGLGTRQLAATTRFGSDGFAPPEQYLRSGILGKYTDVYALGATLYFLLTGTIPTSAPERAMGGVLLPAHQINPSISRHINDAVANAMELDNAKRLQTVDKFLLSLQSDTFSLQQNALPAINAIHATSTTGSTASGLTALTPSPHTPKDCGRCERCNGLYSLTRRRCGICGALLPWAKSQIPTALQASPKVLTPDDSASLIEAVEQAPHGSTIRLLPKTYFLNSRLLIRKSLRLEGSGPDESCISSDTVGYVVRFEGGWDWSLHRISLEHTGNVWANVVEVEDGTIDFRECVFRGGIEDDSKLHPRFRDGNGLRVTKSTQGTIEKCDFYNNGACRIELDKESQILVGENHYWSNNDCDVRYGLSN